MSRMFYVKPTQKHATVPTLSTGTAATGYPVVNVVDGNPANPLRLTAAGSLALQYDLGSALAVKLVAIFNHNIASESSDTITLQANTAASWGSPAQSVVLTRNGPASPDGYRPNSWIVPSWFATAYRYWRIVTAGTGSVAPEIGEVWMCTDYQELPVNPDWGLHDQDIIMGRRMFETAAGVQWRSASHGRRRRLTGQMDTSDTELVTVQDWWRTCKGSDSRTVIIPNPDGGGSLTYQDDARLVRWNDDINFDRSMNFLGRNVFPVGWTEEARG